MALADAQLAAELLTVDEYMKGHIDAVSTELVEYWAVMGGGKNPKNVKFNKGGRNTRWLLATKRGTVAGFERTKLMDVNRVNRNIEAQLGNRGYSMAELIHWTDLVENKGPEERLEHEFDVMEGMKRDYRQELTYGFYHDGSTRVGGLGFKGLDAAIIITGTYAGIDVTVDTNFAGVVKTTSEAELAGFSQNPLRALNYMHRQTRAGTAGGQKSDKPDVAFISYENFDIIAESNHRQFVIGGDSKAMEAGWRDHFTFRGTTYYPSDTLESGLGIAASDAYLLNTKYIDFRFPTKSMILYDRFEERFPKAQVLIQLTYGLMRVKSPRTCGRFTLA